MKKQNKTANQPVSPGGTQATREVVGCQYEVYFYLNIFAVVEQIVWD